MFKVTYQVPFSGFETNRFYDRESAQRFRRECESKGWNVWISEPETPLRGGGRRTADRSAGMGR